MSIIKYDHHNVEVSVQSHLKGRHREHCLCYKNCKFFKPNDTNNCEIAQQNFRVCLTYDIVAPIFECPKYEYSDLTERIQKLEKEIEITEGRNQLFLIEELEQLIEEQDNE